MTESLDAMFRLRVVDRIAAVPAARWQALLGDCRQPFLSHAFLDALEQTACVDPDKGWQPYHLLLENREGRLLGAVPMYLKNHSYGEYIFDWAWARAYQARGLSYYPKLSIAIPFSPVSGPRLLLAPHSDASVAETLAMSVRRLADESAVSSFHVLHHPSGEAQVWRNQGALTRHSYQFHWHNRDYPDFDAFLATFGSERRKKLRRERRLVRESGLRIQRLSGADLKPEHWQAFHRFYRETYRKRSGFDGYLNQAFFLHIGSALADQCLLILASDGDTPIAGALCLFDDTRLYGRYWGCTREVNGLHFELCYYQGMEFCIERGLHGFEPGAQGEYKVHRGFEPQLIHSSHYLAEPGFSQAIAGYLEAEKHQVEMEMAALRRHLPYRVASDV